MRDENISVPDFLSKEQAQKRLDRDVAREKLRYEMKLLNYAIKTKHY